MDFEFNGHLFQWDEEKAKINKIKHGISFKTAVKVFQDENRLETFDWEHSRYEDRYQVIGLVDDVLFVVYTERRDKIRLISAREATEEERRKYYGKLGVLHDESR